MMSDQLIEGGAQTQLNCSRKPKQLPKEKGTHARQQAMTISSKYSKKGSSLRYWFFQDYKHNLSLGSSSATPLL